MRCATWRSASGVVGIAAAIGCTSYFRYTACMHESIRFYCGLSHRLWQHHPCAPGPYACVSPIVGRGREGFGINNVSVPPGTLVLQDSGAFGEPLGSPGRLSFADALKRQERHAERYDYADNIAYRASYDLLIDHRFAVDPSGKSSRRKIQRLSEQDGYEAIDQTIRAAHFLNVHRNGYPLALNVQGVTPRQYYHCVRFVVPMLRNGDILGLGGWCILGRLPSMMVDFLEMLALIIPFLAREGVPCVHLYGCLYTPALAALLAICDEYNIAVSLDSAFPAYAPIYGTFGYGSWRRKRFSRPHVLSSCREGICPPDTHCLGLECARHVALTRDWLAHLPQWELRLYSLYRRNLDQYQYGQILDLRLGKQEYEFW